MEVNYTLFSVYFTETVDCVLCAVGGSDINIMPHSLLQEVSDKNADMKVVKLNIAHRIPAHRAKASQKICEKSPKTTILDFRCF